MAKNEQSREANQPIWFDGKSINEALFCDDFLGRHKIIYTNGAFFTPDGRVTDELPLRGEIFEELKCCAVSNIPRKISNIVELMKLAALAYLLETYAGALPTWMAPEQVRLLPVTDRAVDYCREQAAKLTNMGFRVTVDDRSEKIGKKIRDGQMEKVPYMLIVGDRDIEAGTVSPRHRTDGDLGAMTLDAFAAQLREVVDSKAKK